MAFPYRFYDTSWAPRQLYLEDNVVGAFKMAEETGITDSNGFYAEAKVREEGTQFHPRPWLIIEAIESEVKDSLAHCIDIISDQCEQLSKEFGWDNSKSTLVALLPVEMESPWMPGRWGYFVAKVPYNKICLPYHLVNQEEGLIRTIRHEFTHNITNNVCNGNESRWVTEGIATYNEGRRYKDERKAFAHGDKWLEPSHLEGILAHDNRDPDRAHDIQLGYMQANLLVQYLIHLNGMDGFKDFLHAIGNESIWAVTENKLLGISLTGGALHHVYKLSEPKLFEIVRELLIKGELT